MDENWENQERPIFRDISSLPQLPLLGRSVGFQDLEEPISSNDEDPKPKRSRTAERTANFRNSEKRRSKESEPTWTTSSTNSEVAKPFKALRQSTAHLGSATAGGFGIWTSPSDQPTRDQRIDQWTPPCIGETPTPGRQDPFTMTSDSQTPSSWTDRRQACGSMDTQESQLSS